MLWLNVITWLLKQTTKPKKLTIYFTTARIRAIYHPNFTFYTLTCHWMVNFFYFHNSHLLNISYDLCVCVCLLLWKSSKKIAVPSFQLSHFYYTLLSIFQHSFWVINMKLCPPNKINLSTRHEKSICHVNNRCDLPNYSVKWKQLNWVSIILNTS